MDINGKNIVLTGASSGIGLEILKLLTQFSDVKIIAVARHTENIPQKENIIYPFVADLSNQMGIDGLFDYSKKVFDQIDIFIANAGFAYFENLYSPDWEHIKNIFDLNTFSPIYSLEKLLATKSNRKKYFICNVSAVAHVPLPYYSLYCSTKAAIHQFLDTYKYETDHNIQIATVYPVATRTPFFKKAFNTEQVYLPFLSQEPITVAKAIIKGIKQNKTKIYPSLLFRVFNYWGRIFPFLFNMYSKNEQRKAQKSFSK